MTKKLLLLFSVPLLSLLFSKSLNAQACLPTYANACTSNDFINNFSTTGGVTNISNLNSGCNGVLPNNYNVVAQTVSQVQGLSVNLTVQGGPVWSQGFSVFVDWNQDNDFLDAGEDVYASPNAATTPFNGTIAVPLTATPGSCNMRVVCSYNNVPATPCDVVNYGEAEEYTFNVIASAPCAVIDAGAALVTPNPPCPGTNIQLSLSGQTLAGGLTYEWLESTVSAAGPWAPTVPPGAAPNHTLPAPLVQTWYACVVTCPATMNFDTSAVIAVIPGVYSPYSPCFCPPTYANGGGADNITDVVLGTLNNSTAAAGNPNPFWVDYTSQQTGAAPTLNIPNMLMGQAYNASVTMGGDGNQYSAIWVDFNHNYIFEAAEYFSSGLNAGANGTATISIIPTLGANVGLTRMRVRGGDDQQMTAAQGCAATNSGWGETEDYVVNILAPGPYDPAVTSIVAPPSGCIDSNQFLSVGVCNFGSSPINLATNPIVVTLNVNGPNGLSTYTDTIDLGNLGTFCSNSVFALFPNVNLYDGGTYTINTDTLTVIGLTNTNLINDTLNQAITITNSRPSSIDYNICLNDTIPTGNGLSLSNCPTGLTTDSVIVTFALNLNGNIVPSPTTCATTGASNFGTATLPNLPPGVNILNGEIEVTNLSQTFLAFASQTRFNLSSTVNPSLAADIFHDGVQGNPGTNIPNPYTFTSNPTGAELNQFYDNVLGTPLFPINIGYWASAFSCTSPGCTANAGGATQATLKIVYEYVPMGVSWYDAAVGGVKISDSTVLNPLATPGLGINTSTPGSYTYWGGCAADTNCRVGVNLIIDGPVWASVLDTSISCNGVCDGVIVGSATGGVGTLSYSLNPGALMNTTGYFNGLCAGIYTLTVTDSLGCTNDSVVILTEPLSLVLTTDSTLNVSCFGDSTGAIYASAADGTSPYLFSIAPDPQAQGSTPSSTFTNLPADSYTITVTDTNGCTDTNLVIISEPLNALDVVIDSTDDISCNGGSNGVVYSSASGGTPDLGNYTYSIASPVPAQANNTSGTFGNLPATTVYTISVSDSLGCTDTVSFSLNEPLALALSTDSTTDVSCNGGNDGAIYSAAAAGTPVYSFVLTGGTTTSTNPNATGDFLGLAQGSYTVTVTDDNGCMDSLTYVINEPTAVDVIMDSTTNVLCTGDSSGVAYASTSGGTGGTYNYSILPANTTSTNPNTTGIFAGLPQGTYTITSTDSNACVDTVSFTMSEPLDAVNIDSVTSTSPSCIPGGDGSFTVYASGGAAPYTYNYSVGGTPQLTNTFSNIAAAIYTIDVADDNGCIDTMSYQLLAPNAPVIDSATTVDILCAGDSTGSIQMYISGGTPPVWYYLGTDSNQTGFFNNLPDGLYNITVKDALDCSVAVGYNITEPAPLVLAVDSTQDVLCAGDSNGIIYLNPQGGVGPYTYSVSPTLGTIVGNVIIDLPADTYLVQVTDDNLCTDTITQIITDPAVLSLSLDSVQDVSCFGDTNGSIYITAAGGTGGTYTYSLMPNNGAATTGGFINLPADTYTVMVTDSNGCTDTLQVIVDAPPVLVIDSVTSTSPSCDPGMDGTVTVFASGGDNTYTYTYASNPNPAQTASTFNGLGINTYTMQVIDGNGCTDTMSTTLVLPPSPVIDSVTSTSPSCDPGNDGTVTVYASSGTPNYSYTYLGNANPAQLNNNTISSLGVNTYTMQVIDGNGCADTMNTTLVLPPSPMIDSLTSTPPSCNPGMDGTITVYASGGTAASGYTYTYTPLGPNPAQASNMFTALGASTYTMQVIDDNGCTDTMSVQLITPGAPTIVSDTSVDILCHGDSTGSITVVASGGVPPLTYSIQPANAASNTTGIFTNLPADNYVTIVTDSIGCTNSVNTPVNQPMPIVIVQDSLNNVSCNGLDNGAIYTSVSGGIAPYNYSLSSAGTPTAPAGGFTGLAPLSYTLTVTDANSCIDSLLFTITEPQALALTLDSSMNLSCAGSGDGAIYVTAAGGILGYTYSINPPNGTNPNPGDFVGLSAATYTVVVEDANACLDSVIETITQPPGLSFGPSAITDESCAGNLDGGITVATNGGTGVPIFDINPDPQLQSGNTTGIFTGLGAGIYTITSTDSNGCDATTIDTVANQPLITITSVTADSVSCFGANDGGLTVTTTGGTNPITYSVNPMNAPNNNTGIFTGLSGTSMYTVLVSDSNNCTATDSIEVYEPPVLAIDSVQLTNVSCSGLSDGGLTVYGSGGNGGFVYSLPPTAQSNATGNFTGLPAANNYIATVTDAKGCDATSAVVITEPLPLTHTVSSTNVQCFGGADGTITITPTDGTAAYTVSLQPTNPIPVPVPALDSAVFTGLGAANNYIGYITDANGCMDTTNVITITSPPQLQWTNVSSTDVQCFGDATGSITVVATGGTPAPSGLVYSVTPNYPPTSAGFFENLPSQTYTVTVTDANNCTLTTVVFIDQNPQILFTSITHTEPLCFGDPTATIDFTASGGVGSIQYAISGPNGFTAGPNSVTSYTNLLAGTYTLSAIDALNCVQDSVYEITGPLPITFTEFTPERTICLDQADGRLMVQATGGRGSVYTYTLEPGFNINTTGLFRDLLAGTYTLTVLDSARCSMDTVVTIDLPANPMQVNINIEGLGCYGRGNEGTAEVITQGGIPPFSFLWNTTPAQTTPKATGLYYGFYTVDVMDGNGCLVRDTISIDPGPCCSEVFLPNAFSPNDDGNNDIFRALSTAGMELKQFNVFNRWGIRIFQTNDARKGWDGKYKGELVEPGTYYYVFQYRCLTDDKEYTKKGDVIVVR